jgi:hypothetical protein
VIIAYFDESGDDGFPATSSSLFALSAIYLHYQGWQMVYREISEFRRYLRSQYTIPVKMELHTRDFLLNKKPYSVLRIADDQRVLVIEDCCRLLASLEIQSINVVINKSTIRNPNYDVLSTAFAYAVQRLENTLNVVDPANRFMIIVDPGRVGKMRKTARRIQRINYIPSRYSSSHYRREIQRLIEDPLEKDSRESYFIQFCDLIAYLVYQHKQLELGLGTPPRRMPEAFSHDLVTSWLDILKPILNLQASRSDPHGIVCYPK